MSLGKLTEKCSPSICREALHLLEHVDGAAKEERGYDGHILLDIRNYLLPVVLVNLTLFPKAKFIS